MGAYVLGITEGPVRKRKQTGKASESTHGPSLDSTKGGTSHDMVTNQASKRHSLPGERREMGKSGHGNKQTDQGARTTWRAKTEGQFRIHKQPQQARDTHVLDWAKGGTSQHTVTA
jgi:hypothetical protein